ncbi:MAG: asparaginase [Pseudomonadota bacterium]|nr:asparaginase [Pseudomonadota bacterium]
MTTGETKPRAAHVVVLGTGGTISGRAHAAGDNVGYTTGEVGVSELIDGLEVPGVVLSAEQVANIDSKDMDFGVWRALAQRCAHWLAQDEVTGVVVTHGTDTLEETAFLLQEVLPTSKPVVLTCAMRPASALVPDGPQNVLDAVALAATPGVQGVSVVCAGAVHGASDVQKVHTYRLDAFSSGDMGPMGYIEEGRLRQARSWPAASVGRAQAAMNNIASTVAWPRVEIVTSHAGSGAALVDLLVRERETGAVDAVQGVVVAATGNGSVHAALEQALLRAQAAGIRVVRATRCAFGQIVPGAHHALPDAGALSPVKARIALMLSLMQG